jgi:putative phosphoesterase
MKIGVISDTHGYFDPRIPKFFNGVEHILHGGDIGTGEIIVELERIAPVTAVLGNNDFGMDFRDTEIIDLAGRKFLVHHIVSMPRPAEEIAGRIARVNPDVVVFGHTHKPYNQVIGRTLYFNPGYAGKPRFSLERSLAVLQCDEKEIRAQFYAL